MLKILCITQHPWKRMIVSSSACFYDNPLTIAQQVASIVQIIQIYLQKHLTSFTFLHKHLTAYFLADKGGGPCCFVKNQNVNIILLLLNKPPSSFQPSGRKIRAINETRVGQMNKRKQKNVLHKTLAKLSQHDRRKKCNF